MKAAVYYSPDNIQIEEMPTPKMGPDEVLVEMKACGICGSDLMDWYLRSRAPLVLGHEPAGIIVKTGNKVKDFKTGERVFAHHHVACLTCHYCLHGDYTLCEKFAETHIIPGGFAQYFKVPVPNLQIDTLKIPENVTFEEATLIEPAACTIRALNKTRLRPGDIVAIIGAGPSGILHTILSKNFGAGQIIVSDLVSYRLEAAKRFGADLTVNPRDENLMDKVGEATDKRGADIVVVTVPDVEALMTGMSICRKGGTLCLFAPTRQDEYIHITPNRLFFSEMKIIPSYSTSHVETRMALKLIQSGTIKAKELITHRFPVSQTQEAFKTATQNKQCLKVVITNG